MFNPSARLERAIAFGIESWPGGDAAEKGADVYEVDGGGRKGPVCLVGVFDFKAAIRRRIRC